MKVPGAETVTEFGPHSTLNVICYVYAAPPSATPTTLMVQVLVEPLIYRYLILKFGELELSVKEKNDANYPL